MNLEVVVRRICLVGAAIAVGPLAAGIATVPAAAKTHRKHAVKVIPKPKTINTSCSSYVSIIVAPLDTAVTPPVADGKQYGPVRCGPLGLGVEEDTFTLQDSGDTTGTFVQFFGSGTIHGTFDLTPSDDQPPSDTGTFATTNFTGTSKVLGGTGAYRDATGAGTLTCTTPDGIHTTCTEKLKLTTPPSA